MSDQLADTSRSISSAMSLRCQSAGTSLSAVSGISVSPDRVLFIPLNHEGGRSVGIVVKADQFDEPVYVVCLPNVVLSSVVYDPIPRSYIFRQDGLKLFAHANLPAGIKGIRPHC